ncbi:MAG: septum formation protein Maf [Lachnospiraceae bacterium]|nr:septum formation protein Maf [Lachnospiraceae bacterium]
MQIVLASQSPRRRELLDRAGFLFEVIPSDKDEIITKTIPSEVVCELSYQKAMDVYERLAKKRPSDKFDKAKNQSGMDTFDRSLKIGKEDYLVIGADTVVAFEGEILGKPKFESEAYDMLKKLSGKSHEVYTGVTFVYNEDGLKSHTFFECTNVTFYPMTDKEINDYIKTGDPMDKAGAYGIQGPCGIYIEKIDGDYNNVVGLPIARVYQELKKLGLYEESGK